jgi:hypothetical protein
MFQHLLNSSLDSFKVEEKQLRPTRLKNSGTRKGRMVAYHSLLVARSHASPSASKQGLCHYGDYSSLVTSAVVNASNLVH